jgi:hypothetical protein
MTLKLNSIVYDECGRLKLIAVCQHFPSQRSTYVFLLCYIFLQTLISRISRMCFRLFALRKTPLLGKPKEVIAYSVGKLTDIGYDLVEREYLKWMIHCSQAVFEAIVLQPTTKEMDNQ